MNNRFLHPIFNLYRTDRLFFLFNIGFWLLLSLFTVLKAGLFSRAPEVHWGHIFSYTYSSGLLWIVFSAVIWRIALLFPFKRSELALFIGRHLLFAVGISVLQRLASMSLDFVVQTQLLRIEEFPSYAEYLADHFPRRATEGVLWYGLIAVVVYAYLHFKSPQLSQLSSDATEHLVVAKKGSATRIPIRDVLFIKSAGNYCHVHLAGEVVKIRSSLKSLEAQLHGTEVKRIHNSYLVNFSKVSGYKHIQNGEYAFEIDGSDKPVFSTQTYRAEAKQLIALLKDRM